MAIDPDAPCRELSVAQQQVVEIAKAMAIDARIIVMDEPSAALTPQEVERLFTVVRELRSQGIGVIYISHRLDEIFQITDRVTVMRDGQMVGSHPIGEITRDRLIELMVGRRMDQEFPMRNVAIGDPRLVAKNLCRGAKVRNVSFEIRRGEVLGLTGLVGAGRTETARLLFGADRADHGTVTLDGRPVDLRSPRSAILRRHRAFDRGPQSARTGSRAIGARQFFAAESLAIFLGRVRPPTPRASCLRAICEELENQDCESRRRGQESFRRQAAEGRAGQVARAEL